MSRTSRRTLASDWSRRAVLQAGVGLATYVAWPRSCWAATASPTNVCIDMPVEVPGRALPANHAPSRAAAAYNRTELTRDSGLLSQALAAPKEGSITPTLPSQAAFLNKWGFNILKVFFMRNVGATDRLREIVLDQIKQWTAACNITFQETSSPDDSHIRVGFDTSRGHASFVGVECNFPQNLGKQTMNLSMTESTIREEYNMSVILHEFGHAIGMLHEHSSPASRIQFADEVTVARYYQGRFGEGRGNFNTTLELVRHNILKRYGEGDVLRFSEFDPDSIMIYALPADVLRGGSEIRANLQLSAKDKEYARSLYGAPKNDGGGGGGSGTPPANPTQFTAGGDPVEVYLSAGSTVELKLIVPSSQATPDLAIYTTGTTRVMLTLASSSGTAISLGEKTEHGSPDFMNEVIKKSLTAGEYKVTIKHPSSRGGGAFKIQANTKGFDKYLFRPNQSQ